MVSERGMFHVDSVAFDGGAGTDGFTIADDGLSGWLESPDVRSERVVRPQGHGIFDLPAYLEERIIGFSGLCFAASEWDMGMLGRQLNSFGVVTISGDYLGQVLSISGRRVSSKFAASVPGSIADYMVSFVCADPRLRGEVVTTDGVAVNRGNFPATPVIEVRGTLPTGWRVNGPDGRYFQTSQALTAGQVHRVDMATGRLTRDGVVQVGVVTHGDSWTVPAGSSVTHSLIPTSGSGTLSVLVADTFL